MATATGATDLAGQAEGVEVLGGMAPGFDGILTPEALGFVASLHSKLTTEENRSRLSFPENNNVFHHHLNIER